MTSPHGSVPGRDDRFFEYVHRELDREVTAIGGHYRFDREAQIAFRGQQVLYLCGYALYDTSCCGLGGCGYALVQGVVERWQYRRDPEGFPVTRLAAIDDPDCQRELGGLIKDQEAVSQVIFRSWLSPGQLEA
jgi:hypothetical protein